MLCLLGPNGAGKTTLFRTLLGLQRALGGAVLLDEQPIDAHAPGRDRAPHGLCAAGARDRVLLHGARRRADGPHRAARPFASPGAADEKIAREKLAVLGIADLAEHDYTRISGGQRQLTLIARALAQEAPILVMDEPTASLDFGNQAMVLGRIRDLAREGYGIVLSTHDPDHALLVAHARRRDRRRRAARGRRAAGRRHRRDAVGDLPHRSDRRGHAVGPARLRAGVGKDP